MLCPEQIETTEDVSFTVSYDVKDDIETYIAFSLTDIDKNIWIYNDNSYDLLTEGKGRKEFQYTCNISNINFLKLKLQVSVRDNKHQMIAFANTENSPAIFISRKDSAKDSKSAKMSSSGLLYRNGKWKQIDG